MGSLFTSLLNSASAIQVYNRQLAVIQNNISNANTPGYVRQTQELEAMHLDLNQGLVGGVSAGPLVSSRSEYAEQNVRSQFSQLGFSEQKASDLGQVTPLFDLTTDGGVAGSINGFFNSFSQLSVNPNDGFSRQSVLDSAQNLAKSFNQTASGLQTVGQQADTEIRSQVNTINQLASQIADVNAGYQHNFESASDSGLDAKMHSTLEQLSEVADFSVTFSADGTANVYLGGQTPLVVGSQQFQISADFSAPRTAILDSSARDITSQVQSGQLAATLQVKNQLIPSYTTDLNTLAQTLADKVNQQLAAGVDATNATPPDLFTYDATAGAALTLRVASLTPDQVAAATPGAPGGNGNALNVAGLLSAKIVNGYTFSEYLGTLGGRVGRDVSGATSDQQTQQGLVDQARSMRQELSGVSLDEEAAKLLEVQRAYQASGKMMSVLNQIMDSLMQAFS